MGAAKSLFILMYHDPGIGHAHAGLFQARFHFLIHQSVCDPVAGAGFPPG